MLGCTGDDERSAAARTQSSRGGGGNTEPQREQAAKASAPAPPPSPAAPSAVSPASAPYGGSSRVQTRQRAINLCHHSSTRGCQQHREASVRTRMGWGKALPASLRMPWWRSPSPTSPPQYQKGTRQRQQVLWKGQSNPSADPAGFFALAPHPNALETRPGLS